MGPDDRPASDFGCRLDQVRPAEFLVALARQFGLNEIAMFVDEQELAAVLDRKAVDHRASPVAARVSQTRFPLRASRHRKCP